MEKNTSVSWKTEEWRQNGSVTLSGDKLNGCTGVGELPTQLFILCSVQRFLQTQSDKRTARNPHTEVLVRSLLWWKLHPSSEADGVRKLFAHASKAGKISELFLSRESLTAWKTHLVIKSQKQWVILRIPTTQNPNTWLERVLKSKLVDYVNINFSKQQAGAWDGLARKGTCCQWPPEFYPSLGPSRRRKELVSLSCLRLSSELNAHSVTLHVLPHKYTNLIRRFKENKIRS